MKNITKGICMLMLSIVIWSVTSCTQIFEENISDKKVVIIAPSNNIQTPYYNQTFWWEKIDGATQYRLQIVSPSFDSLQLLIIDTLCTADKLSYTLRPGTYEWRIRAENYNYTTEYEVRSLIVDTASLDLQYPTLLTPQDNYITRIPGISFSWIPIYGTSKFYIEIDTIDANFSNPKKKDSTANSYYSYSLAKDGRYKWRVRATDGAVYTAWSSVRTLELDRVKPDTVSMIAPDYNELKPSPVTFSWTGVTDASIYKFYLYQSNGTTLYSSSYPLTLSTTSTIVQNLNSGDILWWSVVTVDKAGNESVFSPKRKLRIQ